MLVGKNIVNVTPRGATIVVAVNTAIPSTTTMGIFRSTDTGVSFAHISQGATSSLPGGVTFDLGATPSTTRSSTPRSQVPLRQEKANRVTSRPTPEQPGLL